jgi:Txe/YoeB family toxin of Txe-Axe toxin-antitoxin module
MSRQRICSTPNAWEEYTAWLAEDRAMLKRINQLIEAIGRDPFAGIGQPEPLKHQLSATGRGGSMRSIGWYTERKGRT